MRAGGRALVVIIVGCGRLVGSRWRTAAWHRVGVSITGVGVVTITSGMVLLMVLMTAKPNTANTFLFFI